MPSKYVPKSKAEKPEALPPQAVVRQQIAEEFKNGLSIECLAGKWSLKPYTIERIIRLALNE